MATVREFDDQLTTWAKDSRNLPKDLGRVFEMDEQAYGHDDIDRPAHDRQPRRSGLDQGESWTSADSFSGGIEHHR